MFPKHNYLLLKRILCTAEESLLGIAHHTCIVFTPYYDINKTMKAISNNLFSFTIFKVNSTQKPGFHKLAIGKTQSNEEDN